MPKTYLTRSQKLNKDLVAWIYGQMKVNHVTQKQVSDAIGIKQPSLNYKLRHGSFTFEDLTAVFGLLEPDPETLSRLMGVTK